MVTPHVGSGRFAFLRQLVADGIACVFGHPGSSEANCFDLAAQNLRFDLLAQGLGVAAVRVERPEAIGPALDRALADDAPFLIELMLDPGL